MHAEAVNTRGRTLGAGTLLSPDVFTLGASKRLLCACAAMLTAGVALAAEGLAISEDTAAGRYTFTEAGRPVLTYNFAAVPVPAGVTGKYAVARSGYVHPLYGPDGEILTQDYAPDHPHHRGLYWAWPEVTWKGEKRDLHALQGVFVYPVRIARRSVTNGCAVLAAENVWRWGGVEPIVQERATVTVWPEKEQKRVIDFDLRVRALTDGVTLARRGQSHYGGFNVRLSARAGQKIVTYTGETNQAPRQAWACLTGVPPQGKRPVSVVLLQDPANPDYPGDWVQYPDLNWLQPTFPAKGTAYGLKTEAPLVLRYRLVLVAGEADEAMLQNLWRAFRAESATLPESRRTQEAGQ